MRSTMYAHLFLYEIRWDIPMIKIPLRYDKIAILTVFLLQNSTAEAYNGNKIRPIGLIC